MRLIGHLSEESGARTFGDFLFVQGIENQVEFEKGHGWAVWINDEDQIEKATALLAAFRQNPSDQAYSRQAKEAAEKRAEEERKANAYRKRVVERDKLFRPLVGSGIGPVTLTLILISVGVFFLSKFGEDPTAVARLYITEYISPGRLYEVRHGQVWRLFTPIFVHLSVLHILFNMLWLKDLGSLIENQKKSGFFIVQVLVLAAFSNVAQYVASGPLFGGMSGVIYGLLGYAWMRAKFDPTSGFFIHPTTMTIMLVWLVLCYTGWLGRVANTAHLSGLILGGVWGYFESLRRR